MSKRRCFECRQTYRRRKAVPVGYCSETCASAPVVRQALERQSDKGFYTAQDLHDMRTYPGGVASVLSRSQLKLFTPPIDDERLKLLYYTASRDGKDDRVL